MGRAFEVRKAAKAKTAAAKTKVYSKYGREIYVVAKNGIPDPELNLELQRIIDKAKRDEVPNDIIDRAIEKAKGGIDENYVHARYEGFGPGQSLLIVDCLTDNVNRTYSEVRDCFTKTDNKLGVQGSVAHQFEQKAVFVLKDLNEDEILELAIEYDVEITDYEFENDKTILYGDSQDYNKIKTALLKYKPGIEFEVDEISWIPFMYYTLEGEELENFERLTELLEDLEDVQNIYHNLE